MEKDKPRSAAGPSWPSPWRTRRDRAPSAPEPWPTRRSGCGSLRALLRRAGHEQGGFPRRRRSRRLGRREDRRSRQRRSFILRAGESLRGLRASGLGVRRGGRPAALRRGTPSAVVTAPLNKESVSAAGVPHIGHTEMLGAVAGVADPLTMFETLNSRVFFLTRHVWLRKACESVTKAGSSTISSDACAALVGLGLGGELASPASTRIAASMASSATRRGEIAPAIAEAGAGDRRRRARGGRFGIPSRQVRALRRRALALPRSGAYSLQDSRFREDRLPHLGLPFLRTSVDHGTAFDIAWKGEASAVSMVEAVMVAARYAPAYRAGRTS